MEDARNMMDTRTETHGVETHDADALEQPSFQIILHSGTARSSAFEAFDLAASGRFDEAKAKLQEAEDQLANAHRVQVDLIQREAQGDRVTPSLLLIHAQDHLMTAMTEINITARLIRVLELRQP